MRCRWNFLFAGILFATAGVAVADATPRDVCDAEGCDEESVTLFQAKAGRDNGVMAARSDTEATLVEAENQREAEVRFVHNGKQYSYKMSATSVYTRTSKVTAWTKDGLVDLKRGRFFASREEGMWATATMHKDGTVSGLFEGDGRIMRIVKGRHEEYTPTRFRTTEKEIEIEIPFPDELSSETVKVKIDRSEPEPDVEELNMGPRPMPPPSMYDWNGERWYPGCYAGDHQLNDMSISVVADTKAYQRYKNETQLFLETSVLQASFVTERQLNIRLVIDYLKIYETNNGLTLVELGMNNETCPPEEYATWLTQKWSNFAIFMRPDRHDMYGPDKQAPHAVNHLFTGCRVGTGLLSITMQGNLCDRQWNSGISTDLNYNSWYLFLHELGHSFNMTHPEGNDTYSLDGGIMAWFGDGRHDGYYQFAPRDKDQACPLLDGKVNNCSGTFKSTPRDGDSDSVGQVFAVVSDIIMYIIQFLTQIIVGLVGGSWVPTADLRNVPASDFEALVHNFVYQTSVTIARSKLTTEDETVVAQTVLDAMREASIEKSMDKLVATLTEMTPVQQDIAKRVLPNLDISKSYGLAAEIALKSAQDDIFKAL